MNENVLELIHKLLGKLKEAKNSEQLEKLISEYAAKMCAQDNELIASILCDIKSIGNDLVSLRCGDNADIRLLLTEQEQAELTEAERIMDENNFAYHFQPIVSAVDGEIYSYEALMRPQSDLCPSPFHIMKYAELTNRLDDIERATFLNILGIINDSKESFSGRRVFINSIPKTKLAPADHEQVISLLRKHYDTVVVEMTEQAELNDDELDKIKKQYQQLNIKIAVDDYGTGYSNVQNLIRYTPDYVKIDRSLLSEIQNSPKKRHFVREIIEFCHDNNILALAEGVETAEELRSVILLGADLIQGYYTARPNAEILDTIPYEIKQEIKLYRREREEGKKQHIYVADKSERVLLDRLVKEKYSCVVIGKNGNGDVTISGTPGVDTKIYLDVVSGFKGSVILDNAELSNKKTQPSINIGKDSEVRLILSGSNHLKNGGIKVPEGSKLIVSGDGKLTVTVDSDSCYAIGNDAASTHGELIFEQGVFIENNSINAVCIGSGLGGKISIIRGQFVLNMTGVYGVGIGALYADTDLDLFACDVAIDASITDGVAIGSIEGNCHAYIHNSAIKLYLSGQKIVGVGTLADAGCEVEICEANAAINILADECSAVAALNGDTSFKLSRAGMHITTEGANALAFGSFEGSTAVNLVNSDSVVRVVTNKTNFEFVRDTNIETNGGRLRYIVNDNEIEQSPV